MSSGALNPANTAEIIAQIQRGAKLRDIAASTGISITVVQAFLAGYRYGETSRPASKDERFDALIAAGRKSPRLKTRNLAERTADHRRRLSNELAVEEERRRLRSRLSELNDPPGYVRPGRVGR